MISDPPSLVRCSVEGEEGRGLTGSLLVLRNVVLKLFVLRLKFIGHVLSLGLLSLELQDGGRQLQYLVLDLADLPNY